MLAINHTATGAILGITLRRPELIVPIALISHFVLDVIPHHGNDIRFVRGHKRYNQKVALDGLASILLGLLLCLAAPHYTGVIVIGAFFAVLPDLFWPIALYITEDNFFWAFFRFHKNIQTSETPEGIRMEIVWGVLSGGIVGLLVR